MTSIRNFVKRSPLIITLIIALINLLLFFYIHINITSDDMIDGIIKEAIFGIITLLIIFLIAGKLKFHFQPRV